MKKRMLLTLVLLFTVTPLFIPTAFAQDYTHWGLPEGAKARLGKGSINGMSYSPDGTRLAVASSIGIWLYDADTGEELALLTGHTDGVTSVAFSPDGTTLASGGSWDDTVRLWNALTGQHKKNLHTTGQHKNRIAPGHTSGVYSVAFSPDGTTLASGGSLQDGTDGTVRLWNAVTGQHKHTLTGHTEGVISVAFSPDGTTLASGAGREVRLWNAVTGQHKHTLTGHTAYVISVAFSPDGTTLASGSGDRTVRLWDAVTGQHKKTLTGHTAYVISVAFSPDGTTLASGSSDSTVLLWRLVPPAPE